MVLASSDDRPFDDVKYLGIAARRVPAIYEGQGFGIHVAFLYKTDGHPARLAHLAWHHHQIPDGSPDENYLWEQIQLDETNSSYVASWLDDRRAKPDNIPYGFSISGEVFDGDNDDFIDPPLGEGLTCATFIIAVLKHLKFPLIKEETWPVNRRDDVAWQTGILQQLERTGASQLHVEALRSNVGAVRYRPEEICGAACLDDWPVAYDDASTTAAEIVNLIGACRQS
jgi:hypothetical protein